MENVYDRLLMICRERGIEKPRNVDVERLTGLTSGRVSQIKGSGGKVSGPKAVENIERLGYSVTWVNTGKGPKRRVLQPSLDSHHSNNLSQSLGNTEDGPTLASSVPLISWVQAGEWQGVIDNLQPGEGDRVETTYKAKAHTYALRVKGDSMEPRFPEGCILIVEPEEVATPGKFVIVRQNGGTEATFKQLVKDGDTFYLKPCNPRYPILALDKDAVICGVVKRVEIDV